MDLLRPKPLGAVGGSVGGVVLSEVVLRVIDHYSRLDIMLKLSSQFGWLLSPEVLAALVICGFIALYCGTKSELERIIRHFALSRPRSVTPELFKWDALRSGGISAIVAMALCVAGGLAVTMIPLVGVPRIRSVSKHPFPPSVEQLASIYRQAEAKLRLHPSVIQKSETRSTITNSAPGGFATSGGTLNNPTIVNNGLSARQLTALEISTLTRELAKAPSQIAILPLAGDPEAAKYAEQFEPVFTNAHWTIKPRDPNTMGASCFARRDPREWDCFGIEVVVRGVYATGEIIGPGKIVVNALTASGFRGFAVVPLEAPAEDIVTLVVGKQPQPSPK
jgi:hypothetical protein